MDQTVIDRLRKSSVKVDERDYAEGLKDGKAWAETSAEADELERIGKYISDECRTESSQIDIDTIESVIDPQGDYMNGFWLDSGFEKGRPTVVYARGFAEGAVRVWNEAKKHF